MSALASLLSPNANTQITSSLCILCKPVLINPFSLHLSLSLIFLSTLPLSLSLSILMSPSLYIFLFYSLSMLLFKVSPPLSLSPLSLYIFIYLLHCRSMYLSFYLNFLSFSSVAFIPNQYSLSLSLSISIYLSIFLSISLPPFSPSNSQLCIH